MPTVAAFDYLAAPEKYAPAAVNVLFGDEFFLRGLVLDALRTALASGREDAQFTTFNSDAQWRDLNDELSTGSLFGGGGRRLVLLEDADSFVSTHRARLEDYVAKPKSSAALILAVDSWAANTRLYKAVDETGLQIACAVPSKQAGKSKEVDLPKVSKWLVVRAKTVHKVALDSAAADELIQIVEDCNLGVIDQDLAKLALYVPPGGKVTAELVREVVGGWRMRTAWQMLDDVADGKTGQALEELDHLLRSGAEPQAIFGQISWALRRYAAAARVAQQQMRNKQSPNLQEAAKVAGFRGFPEELKKAERQLRQLSAVRAGKLYQSLLETDLSLKGSHSDKARARFAIEKLFMKLAAMKN